MFYELRVYEIAPGRNKALVDRFVNHTLGFFKKHGIKPTLFLEHYVGASNELTYLVEWESLDQRQKCWDSFSSDPEWLAVRAESEKDGPILTRFTNKIFRQEPRTTSRMRETGF